MINKSQLKEIYNLQKQCVRLLSKDKSATTESLLRKYNVVKFPDMIKMELCKFGFKLPCVIPFPIIVLLFMSYTCNILPYNFNSTELHHQGIAHRPQYSDHALEAVTLQ